MLRLYPFNWRERYGDELLALVAEFGLTWRSAFDIVRAALVERARRYAALLRAEAMPPDPLPPMRQWTDREYLLIRAGFLPLLGLTIVVLNLAGVPYPRGIWGGWFQLTVQPFLHFDEETRVTDATIGERVVLACAWYVAALVVTAAALAMGAGMRQLGVPEPSAIVYVAVAALLIGGIVRLLYRGVCPSLNKPRPEVTGREMACWHAGLFGALVVAGASGAPPEPFFWSMVAPAFMWMRFSRARHVRFARRRQLREQRGF